MTSLAKNASEGAKRHSALMKQLAAIEKSLRAFTKSVDARLTELTDSVGRKAPKTGLISAGDLLLAPYTTYTVLDGAREASPSPSSSEFEVLM